MGDSPAQGREGLPVEVKGTHRVKSVIFGESGVERLRSLGLADEKIIIGKNKDEIETIFGWAESYDSGFLNYSTPSLSISFVCHGDQQSCNWILLSWWYK
jgi:hypothetical protein